MDLAKNIGANTVQLVGFRVEDEEFGVDILRVQEIIRMVDITRIPNAPDYVQGVINLRGSVIPVIDFRRRFNLACDSNEDSRSRRIVVVDLGTLTVGIIVDEVSEVIKLSNEEISPTPEAVKGYNSECISGVGKLGDKLMIILDLEKLFGAGELEELQQAA